MEDLRNGSNMRVELYRNRFFKQNNLRATRDTLWVTAEILEIFNSITDCPFVDCPEEIQNSNEVAWYADVIVHWASDPNTKVKRCHYIVDLTRALARELAQGVYGNVGREVFLTLCLQSKNTGGYVINDALVGDAWENFVPDDFGLEDEDEQEEQEDQEEEQDKTSSSNSKSFMERDDDLIKELKNGNEEATQPNEPRDAIKDETKNNAQNKDDKSEKLEDVISKLCGRSGFGGIFIVPLDDE